MTAIALIPIALPMACQGSGALNFPTATVLPSGSRQPDGVAVDLHGALPPAVDRGDTEKGLVPLREPIDPVGALSVVRSFFSSVVRKDVNALRTLLTSDASVSTQLTGPSGPAESYWERRIHNGKLDYTLTGQEPVYRESAVELYQYRDLDRSEGDRPARPPAMTQGDLLVRVPIEMRRVGPDRLYGDEITFIIRRVDGAFRIKAMIEDFQPP